MFGRAGHDPNPELESWIYDSLAVYPTVNEWGTYVNTGRWWQYTGTHPRALPDRLLVTVELRSAAELEATRGAGSPPVIFAMSGWDGAAGFPPPDGLSGGAPISSWERPIYRILVRDDLAAGGAGAQWSGRQFFVETVVHELGHAAQSVLMHLYDEAWLAANLCDVFGVPTTHWNDPDLPWSERVIEASAEAFKDVAFPNRRYSNRTHLPLPESRYDDFLTVMFDYIENAYWETNNTDETHMVTDTAFDNLGTADYVTALPSFADHSWFQFVGESIAAATPPDLPILSNVPGAQKRMSAPHILSWPPTGEWTLHYDFSYGDWDTPGAYLFEDIPPPGGNPANRVHARFSIEFWDLTTTPGSLGTPYGHYDFIDLLDTGSGIPPSSGDVAITIPAEMLATIPEEGCTVFVGQSSITLPDYVARDTDQSHFPWHDLALKRPRPPLREMPWPYGVAHGPGVLHLGTMIGGRAQVPWRVRGRKIGFS